LSRTDWRALAEGGTHDTLHDQKAGGEEDQQKVIVETMEKFRPPHPFEVESEEDRDGHPHSVRSSGEVVELEKQGKEDHGQGHGQDGEKDLGVAHAEKPENQGDHQGKEKGGRDQDLQPVPIGEVAGDHGHGIGPGGEIGPVAEGKQAGVAEQQVENPVPRWRRSGRIQRA